MPSDLPTGAHLPTGAPLPIPPPPPPPVAPSARPGDEAPRRLHPITPVLDLVVGMRQAALPLLVAALAGPDAMWALVAAVFVAAGILAFRVAQWRRFTYRIAGGELRVEEGILQRSQRALPLARIQQVDIERSLRHRITGVAVLRVDAASGGGGAEVSLAVVSDQDAQRLRNLLLAAKAPAQSPDGGPPVPAWAGAGQGAVEPGVLGRPAPREQVLLKIPALRLALAGVTGAHLVVMLGIAGSVFGVIDDLPGELADDLLAWAPQTLTETIALVLLALPLWLALAATSAILTNAGFTLTRRGDELQLRRGLLDQRHASTTVHRIQAVRVQQNLLRRWLGLASIQLQSAGSGTTATGEVSRITIPVIEANAVERMLGHLLPRSVLLPPLVPAPPAARRRAIARRVAPVIAVAALLALLGSAPAAAAVALLTAPAAALGELAYRSLGHATVPAHAIARRGVLIQEVVVVPVAKLQSTRLRSTPLQRRAGLATLELQVAGRGRTPAIIDAAAGSARAVRDHVLLAPAARADEAELRRRTRT